MTASDLVPLREVLADPPMVDEPEIGWFCTYTPEEILLAAGVNPRRLRGGCQPVRSADAHLHNNLCPYVRSTLDVALHAEDAPVDGIVSVASCDAMRRLHDAWCAQLQPDFAHLLSMPRFQTEDAIAYGIHEFRELGDALGAYAGRTIHEDDLREATQVMNRVRAALRAVAQLRVDGYAEAGAADVEAAVQAAMRWPKAAFAERVSEWAVQVRAQSEPTPVRGPRIFLAGGILDHDGVLELVREFSGRVVLDDLCTGQRYYDTDALLNGDVWRAVVERQLNRSPCARMRDTERRVREIVDLCMRHDIDGVIYYTIKFCDPHLFDFVVLDRMLREEGIPVLRWESDHTLGAQGQMRTRVEAFMEMLV